jgi:hypothetical protein
MGLYYIGKLIVGPARIFFMEDELLAHVQIMIFLLRIHISRFSAWGEVVEVSEDWFQVAFIVFLPLLSAPLGLSFSVGVW